MPKSEPIEITETEVEEQADIFSEEREATLRKHAKIATQNGFTEQAKRLENMAKETRNGRVHTPGGKLKDYLQSKAK